MEKKHLKMLQSEGVQALQPRFQGQKWQPQRALQLLRQAALRLQLQLEPCSLAPCSLSGVRNQPICPFPQQKLPDLASLP